MNCCLQGKDIISIDQFLKQHAPAQSDAAAASSSASAAGASASKAVSKSSAKTAGSKSASDDAQGSNADPFGAMYEELVAHRKQLLDDMVQRLKDGQSLVCTLSFVSI
eukprot:SAG11_NODE_301_length_11038_cov_2.312826_7_plen_108_part_00